MHASEVQHAEFSEDSLTGEASRAATLHLVPLDEEVSRAIVDVIVDRAVRRQTSAVAEKSASKIGSRTSLAAV